MPSRRAATALLPRTCCRVRTMCSRSTVTSGAVASAGTGRGAERGGQCPDALLAHDSRQVRLHHEVGVGEDARAFEHVAQLPHVAVPRGVGEHALGAWRQADERLVEALRERADERRREVRECPRAGRAAAAARSPRCSAGNTDPRGTGRRPPRSAQIAVRRGNQPHVHFARLHRADALHLAVLEHAQQLGLHGQRQLADLVEEQRAAVGAFEAGPPCARRPR